MSEQEEVHQKMLAELEARAEQSEALIADYMEETGEQDTSVCTFLSWFCRAMVEEGCPPQVIAATLNGWSIGYALRGHMEEAAP